jgi:hypothetical protein
MIMTYKTTHAVLAALAISAASFMFAANASAYSCKPSIESAVGEPRIAKAVAKAKASQAWTANVKSKLGLPWSVWTIADAKDFNCVKTANKWRCRAVAKPCKYVVQ